MISKSNTVLISFSAARLVLVVVISLLATVVANETNVGENIDTLQLASSDKFATVLHFRNFYLNLSVNGVTNMSVTLWTFLDGDQDAKAHPVCDQSSCIDSHCQCNVQSEFTLPLTRPRNYYNVSVWVTGNYLMNGLEFLNKIPFFGVAPPDYNSTQWQAKTVLAASTNQETYWYSSVEYRQDCQGQFYFGFQCDRLCVPDACPNSYYTCDPLTGEKICQPNTDQNCYAPAKPTTSGFVSSRSTAAVSTSSPRPSTMCPDCSGERKRADDEEDRKKLYFWIMIGLAALSLLFLLLLLLCCCCVLHYRNKSNELTNRLRDKENRAQQREPITIVHPHLTQSPTHSPYAFRSHDTKPEPVVRPLPPYRPPRHQSPDRTTSFKPLRPAPPPTLPRTSTSYAAHQNHAYRPEESTDFSDDEWSTVTPRREHIV